VATTTLRERVTNTPAETEAAGEALGRRLRQGDVVLLTGELGAGKTTFVRGVARGAGSEAPVASPTFQLVRVYPGRTQLVHVDLYRIEKPSELADLGLEELADLGAVVVEWGERLITSPPAREVAGLPTCGEVARSARGERRVGANSAAQFAQIEIRHLGGDRRLIRVKRDLRR
jgi:tRNA threonylcarbamoyladenosine biosynthesis protein TsaE